MADETTTNGDAAVTPTFATAATPTFAATPTAHHNVFFDADADADADVDHTPTPDASSSAAVKALQHDILSLKSAHSDLEAELARSAAKLAAAEAEIARSEAEKQSLADQAARLEGDIIRAHEDLTSAGYAAEAASKETLDLRQTVADLTAANAALEKKLDALKFDLEVEGVKAAGVNSKKDADYAALELKAAQLEEQLALAREEKEAVVAELNRSAVREADLGAVIQDLTQRNAELEGKVNGEVEREMAPVAVDNGLRVSWPTAAAAVASTATVAATAVVIYLRAKQR